jgi:hypothetical protein
MEAQEMEKDRRHGGLGC